jgi:universal stress protein E
MPRGGPVKKHTHLMVVLDRSISDHALVAKAARLARLLGADLELFLCDAEHAYELKHDYEPSHSEEVRRNCVTQAIQYLTGLRASAGLQGTNTSVSAACESPLYEGIVHKVRESRPDMVLKNASGVHSPAQAAFDPNDWQLMRTCPVTLLMTRGRAWHVHPRFAAAVDVSAEETAGVARGVLEASAMLSAAHGCETDVLYSEAGDASGDTIAALPEALRRLAEQCHVDVDGVRILEGSPERTLPAALQEGHYDVLTLGALTHRPGVAKLVGTLTSRLVDAADCDFVLVKPEGPTNVEMKSHAYASNGCRSE